MIYLDANATTQVMPVAAAAALRAMSSQFGNPSSTHCDGLVAQAVLAHMQRAGIALDGACLEYASSSLPSVYCCNIWSGTQSKLLCMTGS